jgi:UDP-N-acetylmuramoyl-tripeptide--D-alanyl-D-alanine ligase
MDPRTLSQVARMAGGALHVGTPGLREKLGSIFVTTVGTDSRSIQAGQLFVALRGEHFDGHDFLSPAYQAGAAAALVDRYDSKLADLPQVVVNDTLGGLQRLARCYRAELRLAVVAVTGSNGKTSTKEMIAAVLREKFKVAKTAGNLNNHIGVPLTILEAAIDDQVGVFEMGMNHAGELAPLIEMVRARIGVITNIGMTHIGNLGSREAIAAEKALLAEAIPKEGFVVLNAHDDFSDWIAQRCVAQIVRVGINLGDVQATEIKHEPDGERFTVISGSQRVSVKLPVLGEHMIVNACLAVAVGLQSGMTLDLAVRGLEKTSIPGNRLKVQKIGSVLILNDAYNANPDSVIAALKTALNIPVKGRRIAVLGNMGELGLESEAGHRQVGKAVADFDFDELITVGADARLSSEAAREAGLLRAQPFDSHAEAIDALNDLLQPGDLVVVKGSRSAAMERVVLGLEAIRSDARWRAP